MALEILGNLEGVQHEYYFDFESLFYTLIWAATFCGGPYGQKRKDLKYKDATVAIWNGLKGLNAETIYDSKRSAMTCPKNFAKNITSQLSGFFKPLFPAIESLRKLLNPTTLDITERNELVDKVVPDNSFNQEQYDSEFKKLELKIGLSLLERSPLAVMEDFIKILEGAKSALEPRHCTPMARPQQRAEGGDGPIKAKRGAKLQKPPASTSNADVTSVKISSNKRKATGDAEEPSRKKSSKKCAPDAKSAGKDSIVPAASSSKIESFEEDEASFYVPVSRIHTPSLESDFAASEAHSAAPSFTISASRSNYSPAVPSGLNIVSVNGDIGLEDDVFGPILNNEDKAKKRNETEDF